MTEHTVKAFDRELQDLVRKISEMGRLAEKQIAGAIAALSAHDVELARRVIAADARVDVMQREIEELAILTLARRQPMAVDLREIVGTLRLANALERIGDYAKNIAKRLLASEPDTAPSAAVQSLKNMADLVLTALRGVLDAFVRRDLSLALRVWRNDKAIDAAYSSLFRALLTYMMEDPRNILPCTHLLFCAKHVERIGDHATNIAETVYYVVQGAPLTEERPRGEAFGAV
ncbi:MAG TPA: phosphate signaling complex protein PhoU [Pseudolabrys sp.]|nr:phosphate signaling complex protein PhoU [Pseudolabrys sp.]